MKKQFSMQKIKLSPTVTMVLLNCFSFIMMVSCDFSDNSRELKLALEQAGANKKELEKVIVHYKKNPEDSLKLRAAYFLIENMPYYSWQAGLNKFDGAFDSIAKIPIDQLQQRRLTFEFLLDSISKIPNFDNPKTVRDIETLQAAYLIENIDLAFEAWHRHPIEKRAGFTDFCNFILPYRNYNEPLEPHTRKKFMEAYGWAFDSLKSGASLESVADTIIQTFGFKGMGTIRAKYPIPLSISQFEKCRMGLCNDEVNYFVHLFRAIGINSSEEFIPRYGNSYSTGHSFLRLKYANEIYCVGELREIYKEESIPKVYRRTYSKKRTVAGDICFYVDVTTEYKPTIDVAIDVVFNKPPKSAHPVLCVFYQKEQWFKVVEGIHKNNKFLFDRIGTNVLYLPGYYFSGELYAINYPFFVLQDKTIHYWKPQTKLQDSIILLRKAGLKQPRSTSRKHWLDSLDTGIFQGANNPNFKNAQILAEINNLNSTHPQLVSVNSGQPFQYVRFCANGRMSFLSLLEFHSREGEKLTGKVIKSNTMEFKWQDGAFDDDPLTYSGGEDFTLGLKLDRPQPIGFIRFQSRNDDNHIRIGDQYELLYWDKSWKSLGIQIATDTLLVYHDVAKNSLLWLRNLTRGKEENVFVMDENGEQDFLGFCKE